MLYLQGRRITKTTKRKDIGLYPIPSEKILGALVAEP